jgi:hypothetical protein
MSNQQRDPWELDEDRPAPWRVELAGQATSQTARWELFALQSVLDELQHSPLRGAVQMMFLYGPLAEGVASGTIRLVAVLTRGVSRQKSNTVWQVFSRLFSDGEAMYCVRFDCWLINVEDLDDSRHPVHSSALVGVTMRVWP